ncbi:hypothetical protein SEPCBS119000_002944 [Sporothrix epigloea]|uniref:Uncharacterized protein n=1 Tax=Sporothrix epigloea TaxID=1892477 RepID=A0ABP0DIW7_9PEZI
MSNVIHNTNTHADGDVEMSFDFEPDETFPASLSSDNSGYQGDHHGSGSESAPETDSSQERAHSQPPGRPSSVGITNAVTSRMPTSAPPVLTRVHAYGGLSSNFLGPPASSSPPIPRPVIPNDESPVLSWLYHTLYPHNAIDNQQEHSSDADGSASARSGSSSLPSSPIDIPRKFHGMRYGNYHMPLEPLLPVVRSRFSTSSSGSHCNSTDSSFSARMNDEPSPGRTAFSDPFINMSLPQQVFMQAEQPSAMTTSVGNHFGADPLGNGPSATGAPEQEWSANMSLLANAAGALNHALPLPDTRIDDYLGRSSEPPFASGALPAADSDLQMGHAMDVDAAQGLQRYNAPSSVREDDDVSDSREAAAAHWSPTFTMTPIVPNSVTSLSPVAEAEMLEFHRTYNRARPALSGPLEVSEVSLHRYQEASLLFMEKLRDVLQPLQHQSDERLKIHYDMIRGLSAQVAGLEAAVIEAALIDAVVIEEAVIEAVVIETAVVNAACMGATAITA